MSPALCFKILQHLQELGLLRDEDIILDPMSGTGITNICAGAMGYKSISVELEEKFVNFEKQNKEYAERRLFKPLNWDIKQGDSRRLSELLSKDGLKSITSPPFAETRHSTGYSEDEENIGNLVDKPLKSVMSPPYGDAEKRDRSKEASNEKERDYPRGDHNISAGYQGDSDNIGALSDKPLKSVMPPPYEDAKGDKHHSPRADVLSQEKGMYETYTERGADNIGNEKQESYLSAMLKVYREISLVSDVLCVVVKCPTRAGKLRRLNLDTIAILQQSGWRIFCQHRALLFEELEQADLFEGSKKQVKGRLSFFKRLSWQKGQPVSSWEDIIFAVRR